LLLPASADIAISHPFGIIGKLPTCRHSPEMVMRSSAAFAFFLALASPALAQDAAHAMIQRAIIAHGGQQRLSSVRADKVKLRGTLHLGLSSMPFTDELTVQAPEQFKSIVRMTEGGRTRTIVHILNGPKANITVDGQPQTVLGSNIAQMRQTLQLDQAMKLVPLLVDPAFSISHAGDYQYNGRVVVGVRVVGRGQRDLRLYFDRETALLVKSDFLLDGPAGGKDVRQEAFYSDYRDVGGYLRPGRVTVCRDGKKVMEAELIDARHFDHIDPREFEGP
jgi:hypothetical protein